MDYYWLCRSIGPVRSQPEVPTTFLLSTRIPLPSSLADQSSHTPTRQSYLPREIQCVPCVSFPGHYRPQSDEPIHSTHSLAFWRTLPPCCHPSPSEHSKTPLSHDILPLPLLKPNLARYNWQNPSGQRHNVYTVTVPKAY